MRKYIVLTLITLFFSVLISCDNELILTNQGKDITVVYGLLNQEETVHYIKINKAYSLEGNAYELASDITNITYADSLTVVLKEYNNGNYTGKYIIFDDTLIERDEDLSSPFYNPEFPFQPIFKGEGSLNEDREYYLSIENTVTGKQVSSSTVLVKDFTIIRPNSGAPRWGLSATSKSDVEWKSAVDGRLYDLNIRFNYYEKDLITGQIDSFSVDWLQNSKTASSLDGGSEMQTSVSGASFYANIATVVKQDANVERCAKSFDFIISVAADEFAVYFDLTKPSNSIVSERPQYTNINNGIGIFSSRYVKYATYDVSSITETELVNGDITVGLGFISNYDFFN